MVNMENEAHGKSTIATPYLKAEQIISEIFFLHALHVTGKKATAEDDN